MSLPLSMIHPADHPVTPRYFLFLYFQLGTHAYLFVDEAEGEAIG